MHYENMFSRELISVNVPGITEDEIFTVIAEKLKTKALVEPTYLNGLRTREEAFPTGLMTQHLNIALPHADPEHIVKPFVFIARLENEITVRQMGDNQEMKTKDLFFLGIKDGAGQAGLLALLMELFMNESFVEAYKKADRAEEIYSLIMKYM
ncbi:PTS sugar transporter subunit IIA [Lactovum odontotermitis]